MSSSKFKRLAGAVRLFGKNPALFQGMALQIGTAAFALRAGAQKFNSAQTQNLSVSIFGVVPTMKGEASSAL